jgi:hypothetical protein
MNTNIASLYEFTLQQMAAESYFEGIALTDMNALKEALHLGTNRLRFPMGDPALNEGYPGYTRMTYAQADEFLSRYKVVHQWSDNPTPTGSRPAEEGIDGKPKLNSADILANTGFSATLIQARDASGVLTGEYTLAMRSTEFRGWSNGGDGERDKTGADISSLTFNGFALAQLAALEKYYQWLKDNGKLDGMTRLNVTGYSLGGHLATVFTEMHQSEMGDGQTVTFNGAGRGSWNAAVGSLGDIIGFYNGVLNNPALAPDPLLGATYQAAFGRAGLAFDAKSLYDDPRYLWAVQATNNKFGLGWLNTSDESRTGTAADARMTQITGTETIRNTNFTANSGIHGPVVQVGIESQPLVEGAGGISGLPGDFGAGHSITLIADSLALQRAIAQLDTSYTLQKFQALLPKTSHASTSNLANASYEADPLENILDAVRRFVLGPAVVKTEFKDVASGFGDITKREGYYANLKALIDAPAFQSLAGKVTLSLNVANIATQAKARVGFEEIVALETLAPFVLNAAGAEGQSALEALWISAAWAERHNGWLSDKASLQTQGTPASYTDSWITDRALLLQSVLARNSNDSGTIVANSALPTDRVVDMRHVEPGSTTSTTLTLWNPANNPLNNALSGGRPHQLIAFGGDAADSLGGTAETQFGDSIYGGAGR